jgi:hypothetical protein
VTTRRDIPIYPKVEPELKACAEYFDLFTQPTDVHIFRCSTNRNKCGATLDRTGANLPATLCANGQWQFSGTTLIKPDEPARIGVNVDELSAAILDHGWYVWQVSVTSSVVK